MTGYAGGVRAITVDGPAFHNLRRQRVVGAGRQPSRPAVAYLRLLGDAGLSVPDALRQISFRLAADDDQFMTIAKFRAARQLWARVAEVVGEPGRRRRDRVHAVTSLPMMTQRDPWVNMLRTTLAAFGAGVGGADTVLVQPFDAAIPGGLPGHRSRVSRAASPATPNCCCWRSRTSAGCSTPPAARGSSRTSPSDSPSRPGSTSRRSRPTAVSSRPATSSPTQIAEVRDQRTDDIAHRRTALTGVNEYPNLAEAATAAP